MQVECYNDILSRNTMLIAWYVSQGVNFIELKIQFFIINTNSLKNMIL